MAQLYGRTFTRKALMEFVGDLAQVGGVRLMEYVDGPEKGVRTAEFRSGSGLNFSVLLERGMDIGAAEFMGMPLAWVSHVGFSNPAFFEAEGLGWLRTWGGGLMSGCGLTSVGNPSNDEGEELGLHGRITSSPAKNVCTGETWNGDECTFWVEGEAREARVFGANLWLKRRIETGLGQNFIRIQDVVENRGFTPSPLMVIYHINTGFPLLDDGCRILAKSHKVDPRTEVAAAGISTWNVSQKPTAGYQEQVFYHDIPADSQGWAEIAIENPALTMKLSVRYMKNSLPNLAQWKQMGQGHYVMGLEPCNCRLAGRKVERENNAVVFLQPGETKEFKVEIVVQKGFSA